MTGVKKCPQCAEEVRSEAKICRFCRYAFTERDDALAPFPKANGIRWVIIGLLAVVGLWFCSVVSERRPSESVGGVADPAIPFSASEPELLDTSQLNKKAVEASISAHCAGEYPADYTMRAACERNAARGASDFGEIWNRYLADNSMLSALSNCHEQYTNSGVTDWSMVGACARNNERGYEQVSR